MSHNNTHEMLHLRGSEPFWAGRILQVLTGLRSALATSTGGKKPRLGRARGLVFEDEITSVSMMSFVDAARRNQGSAALEKKKKQSSAIYVRFIIIIMNKAWSCIHYLWNLNCQFNHFEDILGPYMYFICWHQRTVAKKYIFLCIY